MSTETRHFPQARIVLANFWVAIVAFGLAAAMAMMQAISRANLEVPYRSASMYYMSVTAHGVLMALVFTTFFIMGLGYATAQKEIGSLRAPKLAWVSWTVAMVGLVLAAIPIFAMKASVLYTFYPPLQAAPAFYVGLTLVVVGSWGWCVEMLLSWRAAGAANNGGPVSLAMHATAANAILWLLCTLGIAAEMLFLLIPWSMGWVATVDPLLARMLFWFTGHPLVYFWILPAYTLWYAVLPKEAGGKLFSDPLGRMVFAIFVIISTPVGLHHQFQDPGIDAKWKLLHTALTMVISFPSLVTAFTICASLEVAGRLRGGKGLFGWIGALPWKDPAVASWLIAMLLFLVGGFGGAVNAAYALNSVVHNTAWIQAHFHLTVGSAAALSFMGGMYWLVPKVSGRKLESVPLARVQPWLWFLGMVFFSFSNHIAGLMGVPRRVYTTDFGGAEIATTWKTLTTLSALGGVVLFASAALFMLVMFSTLFAGAKEGQRPIEWAEALGGVSKERSVWDKLGLWFVVAVVLVVIAYGLPLWDHFQLERFGSPGFKPF
jgi:cytochrome c oxidase subunit 1